ncbi:ankyrin repeat protein [Apiospora arundinis]|uniref:Ankyrin repeat protein n=1 Tax=Apiospora arundinis TaxID=335852 RepID=A0ABR2I9E5_9PEZI
MQKYDVPESSAEVAARGSSTSPVEEGFHDFLRRIKKTKSRAGFRGAFLWPLKYKKAFEELIQHLEKCIDALERVTANLDLFDEPHVRKAVEIEIETMSDVEVLDTMIAASESSRTGTLISDAASQRILTLQRENSLADTGSHISHTMLCRQGVDVPVHPQVNNSAVLKVLTLNWQENSGEYLGLLGGWLRSWHCEEFRGQQYQPGSEEEFRAPTSFHYASTSLRSIINTQSLSSDLKRLSEAVEDTLQPLRRRLRDHITKKSSFRHIMRVLEQTYSSLHPVVISSCDDHFGYLPAVSVLRQLLQASNTREADIAEIIQSYSLPSLRKGDQWGCEALSILTDFRDFQKLDLLFGPDQAAINENERVLAGILALRLVAIYHFWSLVGALEPPRQKTSEESLEPETRQHEGQNNDVQFTRLLDSPINIKPKAGTSSSAKLIQTRPDKALAPPATGRYRSLSLDVSSATASSSPWCFSNYQPTEAIHASVCDGNLSRLRSLLASDRALIHSESAWGTPLELAARCANVEAARTLLEAGAAPLSEEDSHRVHETAMGLAACRNLRDMSRLFRDWLTSQSLLHLDQYQNLVKQCMYAAAARGHGAIVFDYLNWTSFAWSQQELETAWLIAIGRWEAEVVDMLHPMVEKDQKAIEKALRRALAFKVIIPEEERGSAQYKPGDELQQYRIVLRLCYAGGDVNSLEHGESGRPLLHKAVSSTILQGGTKALLDGGGNAEIRDSRGRTALHFLSYPKLSVNGQGHSKSEMYETGVRLLVEKGAKGTTGDAEGETPLQWAAMDGSIEGFHLFLSSCADRDAALASQNSHGEILLHYAAAGGQSRTIAFLLNSGLDVNATSQSGWTPLLCALAPAFAGGLRKTPVAALRAARILLSNGATPTTVTAEGWTALHCIGSYPDLDATSDAAALARELMARDGMPSINFCARGGVRPALASSHLQESPRRLVRRGALGLPSRQDAGPVCGYRDRRR